MLSVFSFEYYLFLSKFPDENNLWLGLTFDDKLKNKGEKEYVYEYKKYNGVMSYGSFNFLKTRTTIYLNLNIGFNYFK